ncbi:MAG: redoxin domain-containing protein, partial [Nitrospinae bacterium]|nr:redoxin domain-containing protein [Nitrospinota bacterium]
MLEVGSAAPDFLVNDHNGNRVTLKDFRGKKVILWFYPKADTPGCTMEDVTGTTGLIAFQGPGTPELIDELADSPLSEMRPFSWAESAIQEARVFVGRTGYTGEDGFEMLVQEADV